MYKKLFEGMTHYTIQNIFLTILSSKKLQRSKSDAM